MSFALRNSWADTLKADKTHYKEFKARSQISASFLLLQLLFVSLCHSCIVEFCFEGATLALDAIFH